MLLIFNLFFNHICLNVKVCVSVRVCMCVCVCVCDLLNLFLTHHHSQDSLSFEFNFVTEVVTNDVITGCIVSAVLEMPLTSVPKLSKESYPSSSSNCRRSPS